MKTEIVKIKGNWKEVLDDCRLTVGKEPSVKDPSTKFKKAIIIAEHSPIRDISIKWIWKAIPHWVTVHWSRHKWECFIRTQRTDRTGVLRDKLPQDEPQDFIGEANVQHLIDTWRKRLCSMASPTTRHYAEDFKIVLRNYQPEISNALVPNCVYRGGCPELNGGCGWYAHHVATYPRLSSINIQERYDEYNRIFYASEGFE